MDHLKSTDQKLEGQKQQLQVLLKELEETKNQISTLEPLWHQLMEDFDTVCLPNAVYVKLQMNLMKTEGDKAIEQVDEILKEMQIKVKKQTD